MGRRDLPLGRASSGVEPRPGCKPRLAGSTHLGVNRLTRFTLHVSDRVRAMSIMVTVSVNLAEPATLRDLRQFVEAAERNGADPDVDLREYDDNNDLVGLAAVGELDGDGDGDADAEDGDAEDDGDEDAEDDGDGDGDEDGIDEDGIDEDGVDEDGVDEDDDEGPAAIDESSRQS